MEVVGFMAEKMSHQNDLTFKLQGEKHTIYSLISAVDASQKKWNFFNPILKDYFNIFQAV